MAESDKTAPSPPAPEKREVEAEHDAETRNLAEPRTLGDPPPEPAHDAETRKLSTPPPAATRAPEPDVEPAIADDGPKWLPFALAAIVPILFFFILPPLTKSGLWDPYELNVADLARRMALTLHGATNLALEGADNSLPHLNDLGRPQLPFTSIALGFKFFGLHEWAGRAPLALWGVIGVLVTYGFVARLIDRRAGLFSAVALTTMPLYFVHARTMLGDIVMMTAFAMIFGGFAVATFGAREGDPNDGRTRGLWLMLAILGWVVGFFTRGAFIGVGLPTLAVGAAYLIALGNSQHFDKLAHSAATLALAIGVIFTFLGLRAIDADKFDDQTVIWAGTVMKSPSHYPTFDFIVGHVAPSLAPWSAFAPFAVGRLFAAPTAVKPAAFARESQARLVLLVGVSAVLVAHGWMAAKTDLVTFSAPAAIAAVCGIALRDYERGAHPSLAVGVGTAVLLGCLHHELHNLPEKAFQAFSVAAGATFPESFKNESIALWTIVLMGFAAVTFLTWVERDPEREPFEPKGYLKVTLALRDAWDGMLALAYFAIVAGASLAGLAVWYGTRSHSKWLPVLSSQMRELVLNAWWITAFAPLAVVFATYFWADVWVWAFDRAHGTRRSPIVDTATKERLTVAATRGFEPFEELAARLKTADLKDSIWKLLIGRLEVTEASLDSGIPAVLVFLLVPLMYLQVPGIVFYALWAKVGLKVIVALALAIPSGVALFLVLGFLGDIFRGSRSAFLVVFGVTVGAILCVSYYPALANQLSPKEVFESYQKTRKPNEPLALFGVGGRTAAYYAGGQPLVLKDTQAAYDWLMAADPGTRRFAAVRADELPRLNRTYREHTHNGQNLPVLDARSSQIILVASSLEGNEKNQNPLGRIVLTSPPKPQHKLDANFEDKLEVLGYDIVDANGHYVDSVGPGKKYHMRTYFRALQNMTQEWEMFIHIDGFHRRHNGDHKVCEGKYPMTYWLKDDVLMDDHEFSLEPNFSPGPYTLYFGLFIGETRLKLKSGPGDSENRVNGGALKVQ